MIIVFMMNVIVTKSVNEVIKMVLNSIRNIPLRTNDHLIMCIDNCTSDIFYLMSILLKLCSSVRIKFMLVGHTYNNCDRGFA
jgi:hypothetical protein